MKVRASERDVSITYKSLSECSRSSTKSNMKVASERVGENLFTHTASVATSTKSKMKNESAAKSSKLTMITDYRLPINENKGFRLRFRFRLLNSQQPRFVQTECRIKRA